MSQKETKSSSERLPGRNLWTRTKEFIKKFQIAPEPTIKSESAELGSQSDLTPTSTAKIEEVREGLKHEQVRPAWTDRGVTLDSINVRKHLPINWSAISEVSKVVNRNKRAPLSRDMVDSLKPPPEVYPFVPMAASVLAHRKNKEIPERLPTEAEIKKIKPWLNDVVFFVGLFSKNWAAKLNGKIEREGANIVRLSASKVAQVIDFVGKFDDLQQQFVQDIHSLYTHLARPAFRDGWFGRERVPLEDKVEAALNSLFYITDRGSGYDEGIDPWSWQWFHKADYPLLKGLAPIVKFPPRSLDRGQASIAGAELMSGIEAFLKSEGLDVPPAPPPNNDPFNLKTFFRGIAQWWDPEKFEQVKKDVPVILNLSKDALPTSGPEFSTKAHKIAENIVVLNKQGVPPERIVENLFKK